MNEKTKSCLWLVLGFIIYFALSLLPQFPGFASPFYWILHPIVCSFFASGVIVFSISKINNSFIYPFMYFALMRIIGEFGMDLMQSSMLALLAILLILDLAISNKKLKARICVPFASLIHGTALWPLYFQKAEFEAAAMEEVSSSYADKLISYGNPLFFILVTVLSLLVAYLCELLTEKLFKNKLPLA